MLIKKERAGKWAKKRAKKQKQKLVPMVQKRSLSEYGKNRLDKALDWYRGLGAEDELVRMKRVRIKGVKSTSNIQQVSSTKDHSVTVSGIQQTLIVVTKISLRSRLRKQSERARSERKQSERR